MDINRNNYEAWLLDLIEGSLNPGEEKRVREFLVQNPDCAEGFDGLELWELEGDRREYPGKEELKKRFPDADTPLSESNFDLFSIARLEGDLTREQEADHSRMTASVKGLDLEWAQWQKTRLPEEQIVYPGKKQLKKRGKPAGRVVWMSVISSAAAIALIVTLIRTGVVTDGTVTRHQEEIAASGQVQRLSEDMSESLPETATGTPGQAAAGTPLETVPGTVSGISGDRPATLTIRKYQDPPELTGERKDPGTLPFTPDSAGIQKADQSQDLKPVKLVIADMRISGHSVSGTYDRIRPLEIPPLTVTPDNRSIPIVGMSLRETIRVYAVENDITLFTVADAGINGLNRITGSEMALNLARDNKGEVSGFRFQSRWLKVEAPVEKNQ